MEFRWVIVLTLWTLLIGPILDFTQSTPTAHATRGRTLPRRTQKTARDILLPIRPWMKPIHSGAFSGNLHSILRI